MHILHVLMPYHTLVMWVSDSLSDYSFIIWRQGAILRTWLWPFQPYCGRMEEYVCWVGLDVYGGWLGRASNPGQRTITLVGCRKRQPPCYNPSNINKHLHHAYEDFCSVDQVQYKFWVLEVLQVHARLNCWMCVVLILTFINLRTSHRFSMSSA